MNLFEYRKKPMNQYMGLYSRGDDDDVPSNHFQQCQNIEFFPGSCRTRKGSSTRYTFTGGSDRTRYFEFATSTIQSNIPIIFSMDSSGNFYQDATLLINIPFATDFSAVQFFNKLFITFHDGNVGVGVVYMWDNENADFREIAGARPAAARAAELPKTTSRRKTNPPRRLSRAWRVPSSATFPRENGARPPAKKSAARKSRSALRAIDG